jgi:hypothetical protein
MRPQVSLERFQKFDKIGKDLVAEINRNRTVANIINAKKREKKYDNLIASEEQRIIEEGFTPTGALLIKRLKGEVGSTRIGKYWKKRLAEIKNQEVINSKSLSERHLKK